jgi:cytochrome oxidase Cu insertion factor (SCO1/SenC/PrrC family)
VTAPTSAVERGALSEAEFGRLVDDLKADPLRRGLLVDLLREDSPIYNQRSAAATVRMRGWLLLALAYEGLPDSALLFVLEELDNGRDAYLIAAAARALRSYANPTPVLAPVLMRALGNVRQHDDALCLDRYGAYAINDAGTTAALELLTTLGWLGSRASAVLPELEALRADTSGELAGALVEQVGQTIETIRRQSAAEAPSESCCCAAPIDTAHVRTWAPDACGDGDPSESTVFEDQDGNIVRFGAFFRGAPSVVAFFYTRCNNPYKCSLTITKLARVQQLLFERDLAHRIRTAAITYDPAFDGPERLYGYGQSRGVRMDAGHKLLRATTGMDILRDHFRLGVNFVESLVNRHRIEVYVLNAAGQIAVSFERLQWDERHVVDRAAALLEDGALRERRSGAKQRRVFRGQRRR